MVQYASHLTNNSNVHGDFQARSVKSQCFQVQPITCCDLSAFLHRCEIYSIDSPNKIGDFPHVLNFNRFIYNKLHIDYDQGEPTVSYKMNRLSLRNNRLKFKTVGKLPIILEGFIAYTPIS